MLPPPGWGILSIEGFGSNTSDRSAAVEEVELITFDASRRHADFRFAPYELLMPCVILLFCGALQKPIPPGQTGDAPGGDLPIMGAEEALWYAFVGSLAVTLERSGREAVLLF